MSLAPVIHNPCGISSAPYIFTKLLKSLEIHWRAQGIAIAVFFSDSVGAGSSLEAAKTSNPLVRSDLVHFGSGINDEKSVWQPSSAFSWIGFHTDTLRGFILAVDPRINKMCSDLNTVCANLNTSPFIHVRKIASIVSQIISLAQNCGNVTQIMTRFLHIVINSRRLWNSEVLRKQFKILKW